VCTLTVKKISGQVSICRIGPFPCEPEHFAGLVKNFPTFDRTLGFTLFSGRSSPQRWFIVLSSVIRSRKLYCLSRFPETKKSCLYIISALRTTWLVHLTILDLNTLTMSGKECNYEAYDYVIFSGILFRPLSFRLYKQ
jgi:hypothetical protein